MKPTDGNKQLISLGTIATAHGIRGEVKLRSFTADPYDITSYGPLSDKTGKQYNITVTGGTKDALIARIEGVTTRDAAEALRNTELFVARDALPETDEHEYYHADLIGIKLSLESGEAFGTITGVHNFGAGDLVAVMLASGEEELLPFSKATFPNFDIKKGMGIIVPPEVIADEE